MPRPKRRSENKGLLFISETPTREPNLEKRKAIRRHVMRGKNTLRDQSNTTLLIKGDGRLASSSAAKHQQGTGKDGSSRSIIPPSASDLSLFPFCEPLDEAARGRIFNFFSATKKSFCPFDICCCFDVSEALIFQWLGQDPAYLQATLFVSSIFYDLILRRPIQHKTSSYMQKAIKALNTRLGDQEAALADSTAMVVVSMAMVAELFGDLPTARTHMDGLQKIVQLRGGVDGFRSNPRLQAKIQRMDLVFTISNGSKPRFHSEGTLIAFTARFRTFPELVAAIPHNGIDYTWTRHIVGRLDLRLAHILQDLQDFSGLADRALESNCANIKTVDFTNLLESIQQRLLNLHYQPEETLAEACRLAFIGFLTTLFLQIPGQRIHYPSLASQLLAAIKICSPTNAQEHYMYTWTLIMSSVAILDPAEEPWLQEEVISRVKCLGPNWSTVQRYLKEFLWVYALHDRPLLEFINAYMNEDELCMFFCNDIS